MAIEPVTIMLTRQTIRGLNHLYCVGIFILKNSVDGRDFPNKELKFSWL